MDAETQVCPSCQHTADRKQETRIVLALWPCAALASDRDRAGRDALLLLPASDADHLANDGDRCGSPLQHLQQRQ